MDERIDIKTGYLCNNNCYFCVQAHNKKYGNRSTDELKKVLLDNYKQGIKNVTFTGGEFTIRDDSIELVHYAHSIGYINIQLQSNGRMFSNEKYVDYLIKAGVTEFSPALHGHKPEIHDYLTRSPGAWSQVVRGIKNIKSRGYPIISNSVVVKPNYRYIPELSTLLSELGVDQYQFAFVHANGNAQIYFDKMIPFASLVSPYIKKGLQIGIDNGKKVMAEAMPYCVMQGFERFVSELYIPPTRIFEGNAIRLNFENIRKNSGKRLFPQCSDCRFRKICEGPWIEYPDKRGSDEFISVKGKLIEDSSEIFSNEKEFPLNPEVSYGEIVFQNNFRSLL